MIPRIISLVTLPISFAADMFYGSAYRTFAATYRGVI
jgi:hypothetical protein